MSHALFKYHLEHNVHMCNNIYIKVKNVIITHITIAINGNGNMRYTYFFYNENNLGMYIKIRARL